MLVAAAGARRPSCVRGAVCVCCVVEEEGDKGERENGLCGAREAVGWWRGACERGFDQIEAEERETRSDIW